MPTLKSKVSSQELYSIKHLINTSILNVQLKKLDTITAIKYFTLFITFQSCESLDEDLLTDSPPLVGLPLVEDLCEGHHSPRLPGVSDPLVDVLTNLLGTPPEHQAPPLALVTPLEVTSTGQILKHLSDTFLW